jgi:membrane-associated protease RseP (regulator of RpoE activity)
MRLVFLALAVLSMEVGHAQAQDPNAPPAPRGWLGLRLQDLAPDLALKFGLSGDAKGTLVADVNPQGPGQAAGVQAGDVIQAMDGQAVDNAAGLKALVAPAAGEEAVLRLWRGGKSVKLTVKVGSKGGLTPPEAAPVPPSLGLKLRALTAAEAAKAHLGGGLVVQRVAHGSPAESGGLRPGDVVLELEHSKVADLVGWDQAAQGLTPGSAVLLRIRRSDHALYQTLALPAPPVPALNGQGTAFTPIEVEYGTYWDENTGPYTAISGYSHDGKPLTDLNQFRQVIEPLDDPQATHLLERASNLQTGGMVMIGVGVVSCMGGLANLFYQVSTENGSSSAEDGPNLLPFAVFFGGGTLLWVGGMVTALVGGNNERPKAVERYNQVVEGMKNLSLMEMPDSKRMGLAYTQRF